MTQAATILLTSVVLLAASSLLTAFVFVVLGRRYRRPYIRSWRWSWVYLTVFHAIGSVSVWLSLTPAMESAALRLAVSMATQAAGYLHILFLLAGAWELMTARRLSRRARRRLMALACAVGLLAASLFSWSASLALERMLVRVGLRSLVYGGAFLLAGVAVWRSFAPRRSLGRRLLAGSMIAYGLYGLHSAGLVTYVYASRSFPAYQAYLGFLELLFQMGIAAGMVLVLLEEEHAAVVEASARIEHLAYHDPLTGLPNRKLFLDRLQHALATASRRRETVGVVYLDLDRFKVVNDSLGHARGDELLRGVAQRLAAAMREGDTVARLGGDEFTVLLQVRSGESALALAGHALQALRPPFDVEGREVFVTGSAGVAVHDHPDQNADVLLRHADVALYRAKEEGRDRARAFDASMQVAGAERIALETALRRALGRQELAVHYQPLVKVESGQVVGLEALLRWNHPLRGLLPPAEFLALAEATGLIVEIGPWILATACRQLGAWRRAGHPDLTMAVNVSARELAHRHLVQHVALALAEADAPPDALCLEVTEHVALQQPEDVIEELQALRALGVKIALDDFGTGFSSLVHLRRLPIDEVKIDATFVREAARESSAAAIVGAVTGLARELRLAVVAEGVETEDQLAAVTARGCPVVQGYLYGRPLPAAEIERGVLATAPRGRLTAH